MKTIENELREQTRKRVMRLWNANDPDIHSEDGDVMYETIIECFMRAVRWMARKYHISMRLDREEQTFWYDDYFNDIVYGMAEELDDLRDE